MLGRQGGELTARRKEGPPADPTGCVAKTKLAAHRGITRRHFGRKGVQRRLCRLGRFSGALKIAADRVEGLGQFLSVVGEEGVVIAGRQERGILGVTLKRPSSRA